ncbi:MAG: class I SAM-dependent methyltransferase [Azonexus sp.]|jgi:hypothetical protein|uniref:class I SAM-dependent methyltransferase n=1 Tax=Azonexus sp. TaxID=1872668 RepID=UPI00282C5AFA|nr:class I SAM-dependent methyltransferase [Azonexus sp.]MDR0777708.1 class I SAM-dependent methyltransferase [Azonexus sp.]
MTAPTSFPWHRPCPVCLADSPEELYLNDMATVDDLDLSYRVARCQHCGFHYAADLAQPATYDAYYRDLSKYDLPPTGNFPSPLEHHRASAALEICRPHIPADATVADIGCGRGALLHTFHGAGHRRLFGLDPAPAGAASLGIGTVRRGGIGDAAHQLPLEELDLVCLTGVLEHLPELHGDMFRLTAFLAPRTRVLIEVPALERFVRPQMEPFGEFSLEHLQYFSRQSLTRLMAGLGYAPLAIDILPLRGASDSLFGLFERAEPPPAAYDKEPAADMATYIKTSRRRLDEVLKRLVAAPPQFALYGAGSYSARLLPKLAELGLLARIKCIVDGNPNLQGKKLGEFSVHSPAVLDKDSTLPVLVSSFHAQAAIVRTLLARNPQRPLCLLYPADDER